MKLKLEEPPTLAGEPEDPALVAYRIRDSVMPLEPAPVRRAWIDATDERFAARCLPLLMANQAGWFILNSHNLRVTWTGGECKDDLSVKVLSGAGDAPAVSHFGHGILTWHLPYLFRTDPGWQLLVRGPANWPKDGATALEGLVETDWAVATFTMNWQLTRPGLPVTFARGEPICMIVPVRCRELEAIHPRVERWSEAPELMQQHDMWRAARGNFLAELRVPGSEASRQRWQRHYVQGVLPDGTRADEHRTQLQLREFDDADGVSLAGS